MARPVGQFKSLPPTALVVCLLVVAAAAALGGTVTGVVILGLATERDELTWTVGLQVGGCFLAGWSVGTLLWAAAWMVRRQYEASVAQQRVVSLLREKLGPDRKLPFAVGEAVPVNAAAVPVARRALPVNDEPDRRILSELAELNANLLLSPGQLDAKRKRKQSILVGQITAEVERAMQARDFSAAEQALGRLLEAVPDAAEYEPMRQRLAEARASEAAADVRQQTQRAEDLMAVGQFKQAERLTEDLVARYPASAEAKSLSQRVRREGLAFHDEQRRRLYAALQRHVQARQWRQATSAAEKLLEAYPDSDEGESVRGLMDRLAENARIEEVRELRDRIRDLIERRRFAEAVEIAEDVVRRFPDTQAADGLREQIPKLKERAAEARKA